MIQFFKQFLKTPPRVDYQELLRNGAVILDVRTRSEFNTGHIDGAINIPLNQLQEAIASYVDKKKAIITCCASGMRSASAKDILIRNGFSEVYNGGGWMSLHRQLKQ